MPFGVISVLVPMAAETNYHESGDLKQQKFILSQL